MGPALPEHKMRHELILNFHGIGTPHDGVDPDERAVWMDRARFTALLDQIASLQRTAEMPIVLTFDDGNQSDVDVALPELCKRGITATFFVCAGRLRSPGYLDRAGLAELQAAGMSIGSHGMHHVDWRKVDARALTSEISTARKALEDACGKPVSAAAIPFGSYDRRVLAKLRAEQFASAYTSDGGPAQRQAWLKPRNTLGHNAQPGDLVHLLARAGPLKAALRKASHLYKGLR